MTDDSRMADDSRVADDLGTLDDAPGQPDNAPQSVDADPGKGDSDPNTMEAALRSLPPGVALSWGFEKEPQRGPKRELSVDEIVLAAVKIADKDGLAAVTMNRVATSLGFTAMSLYRYISSKDDLLLLMQDAVTVGPFPAQTPDDWRAGLRAFANGTIQVFREHPWIGDIPISGVPMTPNTLGFLDWALGCMDSLPLNPDEKMSVLLLINSYARAWGLLQRDMDRALQSGVSPQAFSGSDYGAALRMLVTPDRFPHLHPVVMSGSYTDETEPDDPFEFGLQRIVDGIEKFVESRSEP